MSIPKIQNRLGRELCHTTQNRVDRALYLYQPGFLDHSAILIQNRLGRVLWHTTQFRVDRALCHTTENKVDRALHLYQTGFSDHSAILIQNRLGRVLCQLYLVVVWQSTLPSLFCTSVPEYSAKPIQSSYYHMKLENTPKSLHGILSAQFYSASICDL